MSHELPVKVTLCQSVLAMPNMESAVVSFTEMGVTDIIPVHTAREIKSQSPRGKEETQKFLERCAKRLFHNSLREIVPTVREPMDFADAVKLIPEYDVAIFAYENERDPFCTVKALRKCKTAKNVLIFIGPERGFSPQEVELARDAGADVVSLGRRIIRAANAGAVLMGMVVYALELEGVDE